MSTVACYYLDSLAINGLQQILPFVTHVGDKEL